MGSHCLLWIRIAQGPCDIPSNKPRLTFNLHRSDFSEYVTFKYLNLIHIATSLKRHIVIIRNHVKTFEPALDGEWDAVVVPSASCTGSLRHQAALVARDQGEASLAVKANALSKKTYDLSELLVNVLGQQDVGAYFPHRVTYHTTCHSLRIARVGDTPIRLLNHVDGLDYVPLPESDVCCGFGGTFSLKNPETSASMLSDKMANIISTGAEILVSGDYSCLMNIGGGLSRTRAGIRSIHLAEVLAGTRDEPWSAPATTTKLGA